MSTFADIRKAAEADLDTWPSDFIPGHFIASTVIAGLVTDYLCTGSPDDDTAAIVGRIEWSPTSSGARPNAYRGGGLKGGTLLSRWTHAGEAFQAMVA